MMKRLLFLKSPFFFCLMFFFSSFFTSGKLYSDVSQLNKIYYDFLQRINGHSREAQIDSLRRFISTYPNYAPAYSKIYSIYSLLNRVDEGVSFFKELVNKPETNFNATWILAKHYQSIGQKDRAEKFYRLLLQRKRLSFDLIENFISFVVSQNRAANFSTLQKMGLSKNYEAVALILLKFKTKDYQGVVDYYQSHQSFLTENSKIKFIVAKSFYKTRDYKTAKELFTSILKESRNKNDLQSEVRILFNLGLINLNMRNEKQYIAYMDESLEKAKKIDDLYLIQYLLGNLGRYYYLKEDYQKSRPYLRKSLRFAEQTRHFSKAYRWAYYYANVLYQLKDFSQAIEYYEKGQQYALQANELSWVYQFLIAKANIYEYLNQNDLAKKVLDDAYKIASKYNLKRKKFSIKTKLANILLKEKQYKKVKEIYLAYIDYLQQNLDANAQHELVYYMWKLAQTYQEEKQFELARAQFDEVVATAQKYSLPQYYRWGILGAAQCEEEMKNFDAAKEKYLQVLNLLSELQSESDEEFAEVYLGLGNVLSGKRQWHEAISYYKQAAHYVEKIRSKLDVSQFRLGYFSRETEAYDNLVECYSRLYFQEKNQEYLDSLFYFDQMGKSRVLFEIQQGKTLKKAGNQNPFFVEEYLKARARLQFAQREYKEKLMEKGNDEELVRLAHQIETDRYTLLEKRLALIQQSVKAENGGMPSFVVRLAQAKKIAERSNISLLVYHLSDSESFVLAIKDGNVELFKIKEKNESISKLIEKLMSPFHNVSADSIFSVTYHADIAHQLYKILLEPAENSIGLSKRIFIVPDDALFGLSFEMLLKNEPEKRVFTPADAPDYQSDLLIKKYSFSYAPSPYFLKEKTKKIPSNSNFLIVANPIDSTFLKTSTNTVFDSLRLGVMGPLPFAEAEAKQIKAVVPQAIILHREEASEQNFKRIVPRMDVLHLATHGIFDNRFDSFSGLFMALGSDTLNDGLLLGYEISDMDLNSILVTLSACETGRGKTVAGEGVLGLPRLFLGSGAKTVLMTLWKVDDQFTSELMPAFYKNLFCKKMIVADALSKAKLEIMKQPDNGLHYEHPFFWAAFCLYGEPTVVVKPFPWLKWIAILAFILLDIVTLVYFYFIRPKKNKLRRERVKT